MKIKIEVDGLTLEHATELTKFLSSLKSPLSDAEYEEIKKASVEMSEAIAVEEKPKATRKKAEKVEATQEDIPTETETPQEAEKAEAIEVVKPEYVSMPTLMQIRSLVAQKAGEHKDSIKSKLVELGAQNVSTLDAKHFQTIFDFLTEL